MSVLEVLDLRLGRLRCAVDHEASEKVESNGVVLLATRKPNDGLGRSVLKHYCNDLQTIALRLNYMHNSPTSVNTEGIRWVCKMVVTYKCEPILVRHGAEVLFLCCKHNPRMSYILKELGIVSLIQVVLAISQKDTYDTDRLTGMLNLIQALCCNKLHAEDVSSVGGLVKYVTHASKECLQQEPNITIMALSTLASLACQTSIAEMLTNGAHLFAMTLISPKHRSVTMITTAASFISVISNDPLGAKALSESSIIFRLLNVIKTVKHDEGQLVTYSCIRDVCLAAKGSEHIREELRKHHATQITLRSISKGNHKNQKLLILLLDSLSVITETAVSYLSLAFLGLNMLIEILAASLESGNKCVSIAVCKVVLVSLKDPQGAKLFSIHACTVVLDALILYQNEEEVLTLLELCSVLSTYSVFREMLSKMSELLSQIFNKGKDDKLMCSHIASCAINLTSNDDFIKSVLHTLIQSAASLNCPTLMDLVVKLQCSICKTEDDRSYLMSLGGLDLILDRALSRGAMSPSFTIKSLLIFAASPNIEIKGYLIMKGIFEVIEGIYLVCKDPPPQLFTILKSLMVHPDGEAYIMTSNLNELF